jgi:hypothetical protein
LSILLKFLFGLTLRARCTQRRLGSKQLHSFFRRRDCRHLGCGSRGGEKRLSGLLGFIPPQDANALRRSRTGGFAWQAANQRSMARNDLLSVADA